MPGFLLDTNHITAWESEDSKFIARLRLQPPENIIWVCPIALGEVECGLRITTTTDPARRLKCQHFIATEALNFVHDVRETTRHTYAEVMKCVYDKNGHPANKKVDTQRHLTDLGIEVNDVWIAAVALEHGLTLLTDDRMARIRDCVPELKVENWLL